MVRRKVGGLWMIPAIAEKFEAEKHELGIAALELVNRILAEHYQLSMDDMRPKPRPARLCDMPGCGRPNIARGLCNAHRQRMKRGVPLDRPIKSNSTPRQPEVVVQPVAEPVPKPRPVECPPAPQPVPNKRVRRCTAVGCVDHHFSKGYCRTHFNRLEKGIPLLDRIEKEILERRAREEATPLRAADFAWRNPGGWGA
jgi:hypothetical protein